MIPIIPIDNFMWRMPTARGFNFKEKTPQFPENVTGIAAVSSLRIIALRME